MERYNLNTSDFKINDFDCLKTGIVVYGSRISEAVVLNIQETENKNEYSVEEIKFENNQFGVAAPGINENPSSEEVRFHFDSPFVYNEIYNFVPKTKKIEKIEKCNIQGKAFNPNHYETSIVMAPSKDGIGIPITLIHPKGTISKSENFSFYSGTPKKLLLHSYGCYGMDL